MAKWWELTRSVRMYPSQMLAFIWKNNTYTFLHDYRYRYEIFPQAFTLLQLLRRSSNENKNGSKSTCHMEIRLNKKMHAIQKNLTIHLPLVLQRSVLISSNMSLTIKPSM